MSDGLPKVLFVDDEQNVLMGMSRMLRGRYEMTLATGGDQALQYLSGDGRFDVIVSDMRMPGMDGVQVLSKARQLAPDTVRVILSGHADVESAVRAINDGSIFRYMTKPVERAELMAVLDAALEQRRLIVAEKEILEKTLTGSINALTEVLALTNPAAFGRARRIRRITAAICEELKLPQRWPIEVAALLSQIGAVTLPPDCVARWYAGKPLSEEERAMVQRMPRVADQLLNHIPRMEPVRAILMALEPGAGEKAPAADLPLGVAIVNAAMALERLSSGGLSMEQAGTTLQERGLVSAGVVLDACLRLKGLVLGQGSTREVMIAQLTEGMILADDIRTRVGALLISRGHEVTYSLMAHLKNYAHTVGVAEPIKVEFTASDAAVPPTRS